MEMNVFYEIQCNYVRDSIILNKSLNRMIIVINIILVNHYYLGMRVHSRNYDLRLQNTSEVLKLYYEFRVERENHQ